MRLINTTLSDFMTEQDSTSQSREFQISLCVSIRAPVKDATDFLRITVETLTVSIRAPVKDATPCGIFITTVLQVSIRAPVKDAKRTTAVSRTTLKFLSARP